MNFYHCVPRDKMSIFFYITTHLLIFEDTEFIWCSHDSLLSIRTPRYFIYSLLSGEISLLVMLSNIVIFTL